MRTHCGLLILLAAAPLTLPAQHHEHRAGMQHAASAATPSALGQAAFTAIAEVVEILDRDPATDWSKVDIEALRQHLIDMNEVTMRAATRTIPVAGGARFEVRGDSPRTVAAIRRMLAGHAPTLQRELGYRATVVEVQGGSDLTVVAPSSTEGASATRIRALGFAGLMTLGAHHAPHHLAIARGASPHAHPSARH